MVCTTAEIVFHLLIMEKVIDLYAYLVVGLEALVKMQKGYF
jgi:hypothetical protein